MWAWSLGGEDPLEEGMATHSSTLSWRIPWTEEPGGLQSIGLQSQTWLKQLITYTHIPLSSSLLFILQNFTKYHLLWKAFLDPPTSWCRIPSCVWFSSSSCWTISQPISLTHDSFWKSCPPSGSGIMVSAPFVQRRAWTNLANYSSVPLIQLLWEWQKNYYTIPDLRVIEV